jgi:hypothetical protein
MRLWLVHILGAGAVGAMIAFGGAQAFAKTAEQCNAEYAGQKAALDAAGTKQADFVASCLAAAAASATPILSKTKQECAAEYAANKPAIAAGGQTKAAFDADCRAGTERIPTASAPAAAVAKPKPMAAPSATEAELKAKCPSDAIVWVNAKSGVYHFAGTHDYGAAKQGSYMCEMDAKAAGDHAAKNEKRP